jgi:histidinol-phosphatase
MELVEAMHSWCDEADAIALRHAGLAVETDSKVDGTPVTVADRAIERALREAIARHLPNEPVVGEEEGGEPPQQGACWILDPIDGTKNYARGIPVYATLLARMQDGHLTDAMISAPGLDQRWWASENKAFSNGAQIQVSSTKSLADADICTGGLDWGARAHASVDDIVALGRRHRGFGDFWGYMLVAQGSMEAMIEYAPLKIWDLAAPRCILETAGGRVTSLQGEPAPLEGAVVASNGLIHDELMRALTAKTARS